MCIWYHSNLSNFDLTQRRVQILFICCLIAVIYSSTLGLFIGFGNVMLIMLTQDSRSEIPNTRTQAGVIHAHWAQNLKTMAKKAIESNNN